MHVGSHFVLTLLTGGSPGPSDTHPELFEVSRTVVARNL